MAGVGAMRAVLLVGSRKQPRETGLTVRGTAEDNGIMRSI